MSSRGFVAPCFSAIAITATLVSACTTTANISDVYTSLDADGSRRRETFFTDTEEIHCIAEAGVGRPDATIEGYIHQIRTYDFQKNAFEVADRYLGYADVHPAVQKDQKEPTKIDLQLQRVGPDGKASDSAPFEAGSYICEFALDGKIQKTAAFNIDFPPCPEAFIIQNGPCIGFFTKETKCPRYGAKSTDNAQCTCTADKGWNCE